MKISRIRHSVAERRYFADLPARLDFDAAFALAQARIKVGQQPQEARWLFDRVRALSPKVILEIGMGTGGTLFLWTRAAPEDAAIVALDNFPSGRLGRFSAVPLVRRAYRTGQQSVELLLGVDSHAAETVARVRNVLGPRSVDFLFIDGDHSYDGVRTDAELYGPMVRTGGLVAFHDISPNAAPWTQGVARFWREFSATREVEERIVDAEPGYGIGAYTVRPDENWLF